MSFTRIHSLTPALRWALLGFSLSTLGNSVYEGSVLPSILITSLPVWVVAFRKTFMTVVDFMAPLAAWLVEKVGGFRALAGAEALEGFLSLIPLLLWCFTSNSPSSPNSPDSPYWKWSLLALSCALGITGHVIDIASEVFEVEAAQGSETLLIQYSGIIAVLSSVLGSLLGSPLGASIASWSIPTVLGISVLSSWASASTRLAMQHVIAPVTRDMHSCSSSEPTLGESSDPPLDSTPARSTSRAPHRARLLMGSFLLAFVPACSLPYILLGVGSARGSEIIAVLTLCVGAGDVLGSVLYAQSATSTRATCDSDRRGQRSLSMRTLASTGVVCSGAGFLCMILALFSAPDILESLLCAGFLLVSLGLVLITHPVIVTRQLLFSGSALARFSGFARFAFALGAASGSWLGWMLSSSWNSVPFVAIIALSAFLLVLPALPHRP
ncbi:hypothetical protein B9G54_03360 [Alloscardovia macacae]|uniref:MFS transporter n=1 Tax=Alloscardovia macacae TaxID=1160091 RepID=A0A1Y2SY11_9BIFI|nr:MFS transporter [Alloscardovia macacae]OTA26834.1 hypothetical protein B9G54_03360 [Alloscardovia macacae]OTA29142.1 hypothetical protein B9T39_04485 [Alloscardovia macacae]